MCRVVLSPHLRLFAGHRPQLSQCGGEQGGEEEGRAQQVQDLQRQLLTQHVLEEADGDLQQGGGKVDAHLHHILGARARGPGLHKDTNVYCALWNPMQQYSALGISGVKFHLPESVFTEELGE